MFIGLVIPAKESLEHVRRSSKEAKSWIRLRKIRAGEDLAGHATDAGLNWARGALVR